MSGGKAAQPAHAADAEQLPGLQAGLAQVVVVQGGVVSRG